MSIEKIYDWLLVNLKLRARKTFYWLSPDMRIRARKLFYLPYDLYKTITGQRHPYEPPKGDIYIGRGDFITIGRKQFSLLKRYVGIKPDDQVLDIGSGIGRTAIPFTGFLNENGRYEGFDVVEKGVNWCNAKIKKDHPNFNFRYVPLNNDLYNPSSLAKASEFHFPYADEQFDLAFLFSIFTHMQTEEIDHYLTEIYRVLKPGGKCLATFFLYKEENEKISANPEMQFPIKKEGYRLMDENITMGAIAIPRRKLEQMLGGVALEVIQEVEGFWRQEQWQHPTKTNQISGGLSYQDVVVLEKSKGIQKTQAVI